MKNYIIRVIGCFIVLVFLSCDKQELLDKKPRTDLIVPASLEEMRGLLNNTEVVNMSHSLPTLSADEYFHSDLKSLNAARTAIERNSYTWEKDIYGGEQQIRDWFMPWQSVFYANVVLEQFEKLSAKDQESKEGKEVKAWALFIRAFSFYELVANFAPTWDPATAASDLGIPLRLSASVGEIKQRASVKETYAQIFKDLEESSVLFSDDFPSLSRNKGSKIAVYALQARIYLSMRDYAQAGNAADKCLAMYNALVDYNTLTQVRDAPFGFYHAELILASRVVSYSVTWAGSPGPVLIDRVILNSYAENDLRKKIFFGFTKGEYYLKRTYAFGLGPFSGLATDEVYLIKAECLARAGDTNGAMTVLNTLLKTRWVTNTFVPYTAANSANALEQILMERRKELVWRGMRWADVKRLNKEGANITLVRKVGDQMYTLPPNDPRYIFPIPDDEIIRSGITQNPRM